MSVTLTKQCLLLGINEHIAWARRVIVTKGRQGEGIGQVEWCLCWAYWLKHEGSRKSRYQRVVCVILLDSAET